MMYSTCSVCQMGQTRPELETYVQVYYGTLIHAPNMPAWKCDACGAVFFEPAVLSRLDLLIGPEGPPPNRHVSFNERPHAAPVDDVHSSHPRPK